MDKEEGGKSVEIFLWMIIIIIVISLFAVLFSEKNPIDRLIVEAIFSDETPNFREPFQPTSEDDVRIWIRTARKNVDRVILHLEGAFQEMKMQRSDSYFDYYLGIIPKSKTTTLYYFEIYRKDKKVYYTKEGVLYPPGIPSKEMFFTVQPDWKVPTWMMGGVFYQIDVDRFYNGNLENDVVDKEYIYQDRYATKAESWYEYPSLESQCEFYGGDLAGIRQKLRYLKDLGVDGICLSPIFVSPSSHKQDVQDFAYVDPHYGTIVSDGGQVVSKKENQTIYPEKYIQRTTNKDNLLASNEELEKLIHAAHQMGLYVVLEGNFSFCSPFHYWMDEANIYKQIEGIGAYYQENSLYRDYFYWKNKKGWPDNSSYEKWNNRKEYAKLNYDASSALYATMLQIGAKWVGMPYQADGWKLIAPAKLGNQVSTRNHFWEHFYKQIKSANPKAVVIGEGKAVDSIPNEKGFLEPISYFLTGMNKNSTIFHQDRLGNAAYFIKQVERQKKNFSDISYLTAFNALSHRDTSRFLTRTNQLLGSVKNRTQEQAEKDINFQVYKQAVMMMMTWPGCPAIYYGDEAGICGWSGVDSRRTYPWDREIYELIQYHQNLIQLRKSFTCLRQGSFLFLYGNSTVIAYARWLEEEVAVIVITRGMEMKEVKLPVWLAQVRNGSHMKEIFVLDPPLESEEHEEQVKKQVETFVVEKGTIQVQMPPLGGKIISMS